MVQKEQTLQAVVNLDEVDGRSQSGNLSAAEAL